MTGESGVSLYRKAQNGGRGFVAWDKLSSQQKGLWENAAREVQYEQDKVHRAELQRTVAFIRAKCAALRGDSPGHSNMMVGMLAFGEDLARMLERGEHT